MSSSMQLLLDELGDDQEGSDKCESHKGQHEQHGSVLLVGMNVPIQARKLAECAGKWHDRNAYADRGTTGLDCQAPLDTGPVTYFID